MFLPAVLERATALIRRLRDERDAARLAGKIEGLKMAARICDATWDDEDAAKAIRAKIAELEATTKEV